MNISKIVFALATSVLIMSPGKARSAISSLDRWQKNINTEIAKIENSFFKWKAKTKDDDLEPDKFKAMSDVSQLKQDISKKFKILRSAKGGNANRLKSEIAISLTRIRKEARKHLE